MEWEWEGEWEGGFSSGKLCGVRNKTKEKRENIFYLFNQKEREQKEKKGN